MIRVSVSFGFEDDNRYKIKIEEVPKNIQLSIWKYDSFSESKIQLLKDNNISINAIHLPFDILRRYSHHMIEWIEHLYQITKTTKFIIHPNKNIIEFINFWIFNQSKKEMPEYKLYIENFQWRKKKIMRTPLDIVEYCIQYPNYLGLCLDTSHTEEIWFESKIMRTLLKHSSLIHLSNRYGKMSHMPFNIGKGNLNLISFVNNLKYTGWSGDIILEYMPQYNNKLIKNYYYLKGHLNE